MKVMGVRAGRDAGPPVRWPVLKQDRDICTEVQDIIAEQVWRPVETRTGTWSHSQVAERMWEQDGGGHESGS